VSEGLESHTRMEGTVPPPDCGGCGGGNYAGEAAKDPSLFQLRRKFLTGAVSLSGFAATLSSRRAFSGTVCANLTGLVISPHPSANCGRQSVGGLTPGFWANHGACWPAGTHPSQSFAFFGFVAFPNSTETLKTALCPPNGGDNLAFQIAAAILNSGSPNVNTGYAYTSIGEFVASFNAAAAASNNNWSLIHDILASINVDNPAITSWCGSATKIC
jgi:hypothetical protein